MWPPSCLSKAERHQMLTAMVPAKLSIWCHQPSGMYIASPACTRHHLHQSSLRRPVLSMQVPGCSTELKCHQKPTATVFGEQLIRWRQHPFEVWGASTGCIKSLGTFS